MKAEFWHERWNQGSTAWNQRAAHRLLGEHWTATTGGVGAVFVPLCGKSVDMDWLAEQGHRVIGNELSPIGVAEFFAERELEPQIRDAGTLDVYTADSFELWCGDFFDLDAGALDGVTAVYDRASMVALPASMRQRYVDHLVEITPRDAAFFVLTFDYDESEMTGPPFSVPAAEVIERYGDRFDADVIGTWDVFAENRDLAGRGLTRLSESLTVLRRAN